MFLYHKFYYFLPKRNLDNYPVSGINISAREVSGDFFSFYPHNESVYFIIADVAGKGIHAGMVIPFFRNSKNT